MPHSQPDVETARNIYFRKKQEARGGRVMVWLLGIPLAVLSTLLLIWACA